MRKDSEPILILLNNYATCIVMDYNCNFMKCVIVISDQVKGVKVKTEVAVLERLQSTGSSAFLPQ